MKRKFILTIGDVKITLTRVNEMLSKVNMCMLTRQMKGVFPCKSCTSGLSYLIKAKIFGDTILFIARICRGESPLLFCNEKARPQSLVDCRMYSNTSSDSCLQAKGTIVSLFSSCLQMSRGPNSFSVGKQDSPLLKQRC